MNSNATLKIQENFRKKNSKRNKKAKRSCPESNVLCEAGYGKGRQSPGSNCGAEFKLIIESLILAQDERWRRA